MKRFYLSLIASVCILVGFTQQSHASSPGGKRLGGGIIIGEPSGLSARYWLNGNQAADFALAYSFSHFLYGTADYTLNYPGMFRIGSAALSPYFGVGAVLGFSAGTTVPNKGFAGDNNSSFGVGVRVPFGLEWMISNSQLGIFLELVPGIGLVPSTFGFFDGGIGLRYYFM